ncbi:MAG: hypothetical protein J0I34_16980 [Pseudonocardia sp.]|uniref:type II toxin-antitoxin system HicB family antitoxin n=1 Tax=unclassified Pseudonocardia TaxID=2619320 RepID=UPI0008692CBE|nr:MULTISPECIES: hypothetical protein [unclassified Pseudonocardia]MBN9110460.1 hypothetical protein [Pseudonocardia sp.]ODU29781.1 MAG: hypothetical protein ABS80_01315 [Pseudonocardia sp. SCN 72-51]ODV03460.1 MAG: hypothetical protein ABT15_22780 [Pseudonocardia sp. SCN 73-27]
MTTEHRTPDPAPVEVEDVDVPTLVVAVESRPDGDGEWVRRASAPAVPELVFEAPTLTEALARLDDAIDERFGAADGSWQWLHFHRLPPHALDRPAWRRRYEGTG